jgi:predicted Zn-dependent protease
MNMVGLPQMPAALDPAIAAAKAARFVELQQSLATAPATHPATAFLTGVAKLSQRDMDGADTSLRAALTASPDFFPASFYLGATLAARGRDTDAISVWQTALITETNAPFVYTLLGDAMLRAKRTADAIGLFREAVILWPDVDSVAMRLGTALAQGGEAAEALQVLDPYLAKHPADQDRLMLAMRLLYDAAVAGKPIESAAQDKARFARYFAAYEKTGGPQLALAAEWKKTVDK